MERHLPYRPPSGWYPALPGTNFPQLRMASCVQSGVKGLLNLVLLQVTNPRASAYDRCRCLPRGKGVSLGSRNQSHLVLSLLAWY